MKFEKYIDTDLPLILEINNQTAYPPFASGDLQKFTVSPFEIFCLKQEDEVFAFVVLQYTFRESELLQITVAKNFQNQGLGTITLNFLLEKLAEQQYKALFLEVRISNLYAIRLYQKVGFEEISRRKNYYPTLEGREDALVYAYYFRE
jgi:[ribosomal protein S18]-alanine N-acetyltransferase